MIKAPKDSEAVAALRKWQKRASEWFCKQDQDSIKALYNYIMASAVEHDGNQASVIYLLAYGGLLLSAMDMELIDVTD